jgi:hypothetical protein
MTWKNILTFVKNPPIKWIGIAKVPQTPVRRLTELQWDTVIETVEKLADTEPKKHERSLFIMNALYSMYLRISELVVSERWVPKMSDFRKDQDNNWWFYHCRQRQQRAKNCSERFDVKST